MLTFQEKKDDTFVNIANSRTAMGGQTGFSHKSPQFNSDGRIFATGYAMRSGKTQLDFQTPERAEMAIRKIIF